MIIEQSQGKLMIKFFFTLKKNPYIWPVFGPFPQFLEIKKNFPKKIWHAQLVKVFQYHAEIHRNLMIQSQEKKPNTQQDGRMDRPISQNPSGYCQRSNKQNCSRLALKSQRYGRQCQSNQKKYCLAVSMEKNSSIHKLILQIQHILGSHEINSHAHF